MPQEDTEDKNDKKSIGTAWWFVAFAIICSLITLVTMLYANSRLESTHSIIINHQSKSIEDLDSLLSIYRSFKNDSTYRAESSWVRLNDQLMEIAKYAEESNRNERIGNLLESELAKIQNEYEVLNLWCALLTVVFLIFSFFSIFKANEMANQSEDALKTMRAIERDVQSKSESIDEKIKKVNGKIESSDKSISDLESRQEGLSASLKTLKDSDIKEIETKMEGVKSLMKKTEEQNDAAKDELKSLCNDLKAQLKEETKYCIEDIQPSIAEMAKSILDLNVADIRTQIEVLSKSFDKLNQDFQEIAKVDADQADIEAEEAEEGNIDADDEGISDNPNDEQQQQHPSNT